jgi:enterochelin esterase-like enzyme
MKTQKAIIFYRKVSKYHQSTKTYLFLFIVICLLGTLMMSPVAFAIEGTVEFPMIESKVLASEQELGVYLPPGYATSGLAYPVIYLFHGSAGTDRVFFGPQPRYGHFDEGVEALVAQGRMSPMIMVAPNMPGWIYAGNPWADYFIQDIIPFVDRTYRTLRERENRGIWGGSKGGNDVIQLAFMRPDLFSVMAAHAAAHNLNLQQLEQLARNYDAVKYPIRFWIHHGRNDAVVPFAQSETFIAFVKENGWEYVFEVSDGDHSTIPLDILERCFEYFSKFLGDPLTAVQPQGKLATKWGEVKTNH